VHEYSTTALLPVPSPASEINRIYAPMLERARRDLAREGFEDARTRFEWSIDFRYSRQVHEVTTPVRAGTPLQDEDLSRIVIDFEQLYEKKYGRGSAFREAGIEMTMFRLTARGLMERPNVEALPSRGADASAARIGKRPIFVDAKDSMYEAEIYDFERLMPGNVVHGPAVIHTPITTIVLQDRQIGTMDGYRNVVIDFER